MHLTVAWTAARR